MLIYVVFGTTGEYSDRDDWMVKAFKNKEKADELVALAQEKACQIANNRENRYRAPENSNPYDPKMRMDYTGTEYYCAKVELDDNN